MKKIDPLPVALAAGSFLAIAFVLCVFWDLVFPGLQMYPAWQAFLPGFKWLNWGSFFLGIFEAYVYGFFVGYVFIPLYNLFAVRISAVRA